MRTERLDKVCNALLDSGENLEKVLEEHGILEESVSIDEHLYIDSKVRCCDTCGYWVLTKIINEDSVCEDCVIGQEY